MKNMKNMKKPTKQRFLIALIAFVLAVGSTLSTNLLFKNIYLEAEAAEKIYEKIFVWDVVYTDQKQSKIVYTFEKDDKEIKVVTPIRWKGASSTIKKKDVVVFTKEQSCSGNDEITITFKNSGKKYELHLFISFVNRKMQASGTQVKGGKKLQVTTNTPCLEGYAPITIYVQKITFFGIKVGKLKKYQMDGAKFDKSGTKTIKLEKGTYDVKIKVGKYVKSFDLIKIKN